MGARLHCILYSPAVAGNIGCIARTCVGLDVHLHIVSCPLLSHNGIDGKGPHRDIKRAAVGYFLPESMSNVVVYANTSDFMRRLYPYLDYTFVVSKHQSEATSTSLCNFQLPLDGRCRDVNIGFVFGNESDGVTRLNAEISALKEYINDLKEPLVASIGNEYINDLTSPAAEKISDTTAQHVSDKFSMPISASSDWPHVYIPMAERLRSYNLASAASMVLWEAVKQRNAQRTAKQHIGLS